MQGTAALSWAVPRQQRVVRKMLTVNASLMGARKAFSQQRKRSAAKRLPQFSSLKCVGSVSARFVLAARFDFSSLSGECGEIVVDCFVVCPRWLLILASAC